MCQLLIGSWLCRAGVPYGIPGRFVVGVSGFPEGRVGAGGLRH